jgi:hypothetical protein
MHETQEGEFDLSAVFKLQPQPEIWTIARHPPNLGTMTDVRGIAVLAPLASVPAPKQND